MTTTPSAWAAVSNDARCNEKSMSWQHLLCAPQGGRPASSCCQASDTRTRVPHPQQPVPLFSSSISAAAAAQWFEARLTAKATNWQQLGATVGNRWVTNGQSTGQPTGAHAPHHTNPDPTRSDQDTVLCGLWHMSWLGCCMMATCSRRAIWRNQFCVCVCVCVCLPCWRLSTKGRGTRWRHWQETWAYSIKRNLS